jgi:hypothetical protein
VAVITELITSQKTNLIMSVEWGKNAAQWSGRGREFKKLSGTSQIHKQRDILISFFLLKLMRARTFG